MGWDERFKAKIAESEVYPQYLLESVAVGTDSPLGGYLKISSHPTGGLGSGYTQAMCREGSSLRYGRLNPNNWSRSFGSFSVGFRGSHEDLRRAITRGQIVQLRVGFPGWALGAYNRVALGQVRNVVRRGDVWSIQCTDLVSSLTSRFTSDSNVAALFYNRPVSTLTSAYVPTDTSLTVVLGSDFEESAAGGGEGYLLRLHPDTAEPFYLVASGRTGNTFTGLSLVGQFGTTAAAVPAGNRVDNPAYSSDHPITIVRRILASTGNGTNGSIDLFPESWGFGIPREFINNKDISFYRDLMEPASGSAAWALVAPDPVANPFPFLERFLRSGGFFLGQHQGDITIRGVPLAYGTGTPEIQTITDADIVAITEYESYLSDRPIEYGGYGVEDTTGTGWATLEDQVASRPAADRLVESIPDSWVNSTEWGKEITARLGPYYTRVPERIKLRLRGWRLGAVGPGDLVRLSSAYLHSRTQAAQDRYDLRRCLVIGGGADFFGAETELELLAIPSLSNET